MTSLRRTFRHRSQAAAAGHMRFSLFGGMEFLALIFLVLGVAAARRLPELLFVIAVITALLALGYCAQRGHRWICTYRLRLLPDGIRLTEGNCTTDLIEPEVELCTRNRLGFLKLRFGKRKFTVNLQSFTRREGAIILEHCSQFLTAEQQRAHGAKWSRYYASLITAPKPPEPINLVTSCDSTARFVACTIIGGWLMEEVFRRSHPDLEPYWDQTQIRPIFLGFLVSMVALMPIMLGLFALLRWLQRKSPRQLNAASSLHD